VLAGERAGGRAVADLDWHSRYAGLVEERDKRRIGEQLEPGGRPKAPGRLALLQRFINTHNHDLPPEWDRLGTPEAAQEWLRTARLIGRGEAVPAAEAARLRGLREALRALVIAGRATAPDPAAVEVVRAAAGSARLAIALDAGGRTALVGEGPAAILLGIVHEAQLTGEWSRMKACRSCEYAFYDRSKNRSAAWCAMAICGNRTKNRAYYQRRRTAGP
jgi:predicted RNA-binding Zn ribbon-like protein